MNTNVEQTDIDENRWTAIMGKYTVLRLRAISINSNEYIFYTTNERIDHEREARGRGRMNGARTRSKAKAQQSTSTVERARIFN